MSVNFFAMKGNTILPDSVAEGFNCSNANASRFLRFLGATNADLQDLAGRWTVDKAMTVADDAEERMRDAFGIRCDEYVTWFAELVEQAIDAGATTINFG